MRNSVPRDNPSEVPHCNRFADLRLHRERSAQRSGRKLAALPLLNLVAFLVIGIVLCASATAQTGQFSSLSLNFGTANIGSTSATSTLIFSFATGGTIGAPAVLTQGAPNLDFKDAKTGSCTINGTSYSYAVGATCTVDMTFTPQFSGARNGAVEIVSNSGSVLATAYLTGIGSGPQIGFGPGTISTVAGSHALGAGYSGNNGPATSAQLYNPQGTALDGAGNLYIADQTNNVIRMVSPGGTITTVAGSASYGYSGDNGPATSAQLAAPDSVAVDGAGNLYIADTNNNVIRMVSPGGTITTVAGGGTGCAGQTDTVGDGCAATSAELDSPQGTAVDGAGDLYIADSNGAVRMVTPAGTITTVAGNRTPGYSGDNGPATSAQLNGPIGVAVDGAVNLYIADTYNNVIRKVTPDGTITTVAGDGQPGYSVDPGPAVSAELNTPFGVAVDGAGNLYIADRGNKVIRKVTPAGLISTVAGNGTQGYHGDGGPATSAELYSPYDVAVDGGGNLYIADGANYVIRKVDVSDAPSLTFPDTEAGSDSAPQDVTLLNLGNAPLNVTLSIAGNFNLLGGDTSCAAGGQSLNAAASCILGIEFAPLATGGNSGSIVLTDNALNVASAVQTINLSGNGISSGDTTSTGVAASPNPVTSGQPVTITATVSDTTNPATIPTGGVTFTDTLGAATVSLNGGAAVILSGGVAVLNTTLSGVGAHTITANYAGVSGDLLASTAGASVTVAAIVPTLSFAAIPQQTYGNAPFAVSATSASSGAVSYSVTSGPATISGPTVTITGAGAVTLSATQAASGDYAAATAATITFTVAQATASVTPNAATKVYGTTDPAFTGTLTGFLPADNVTAAYSRTAGEGVAGSPYTISAALSPSGVLGNYNITYNTANFTITPATAVVTLSNLNQTYSGLPEAATVSTTPSGLALAFSYTGNGSTSYGPSITPPVNPGTYSVTAIVVDPNYIGQDIETLTINQLSPALSLGLLSGMPASTPYGTTVYFQLTMASTPVCPTGSAQLYVDGLVSGPPVVLSGAAPCTSPVQFQTATLTTGTHSVYAVYSGDTYYQGGTSGTVSYTVTQDATTVTLATSGTSVNVDQPLTFTATVTPVSPDSGLPPAGTVLFYDGATQIGTGTTLSTTSPYTSTFTTSALAVGPHSITAVFVDSDGQFVGSSSAILTETVNLIVPTIIWQPNPASLVYGTPLGSQQLNATAVDGDGNSVGGTFGYNFAAGAVLPVGAVNLIATFTPNDPTTYSGNSATVTISVTPAALTVTANSLSMIYGAAVPTFTYQIAGLVNNDPSSVVSGLASCSTSATSTSSVAGGPYAIHCTQGTLNATNYSFTFVPGALTVNQATASVTPNAATKVYGTTDPAFTGTLIGFVATDNVTASYSRTAGETVAGGPYTISATLSPTAALANYTITYNTANFNITLATASVTPNAATKVYGTADPSLTGTLSGFAASDNVTALYSRTAGQTVTGGPYPISATLSPAAALANYNITYNTAAFTISPASLAAVANNASTLYGAAIPSLTGTLTGVVPGDGITASYTTVATSSSQAGSYAITPVLSDPNNKRSNYSAVLTNGTLIIAPDTTITSVQTSASPVMAQSSVTLTANVSSAAGAPSGSVTFVDGATVLATAALGNTGTATLSITTLAPGSHSITAVYAGNVNFTGSASSAITETVQDFHFSVNGATTTMLSATVNPGDTATYTLQIVPENGSTFPSAVVLTLTGLPAGATYTVTPSTIEAGSGTTTVTVKVNTATQQSTASSSAPKGGLGFPKPLMLAFFLPLFGTRKLRRFLRAQMKSPALMLVMLGVLMMAGMTACGSGSSSQPPQTSAMTLTGTSGALQHSVTLNLTVR